METITIEDFRIKFGKRISQLRKRANLTQEQLAMGIGYKDKQVINAYEVKGANPTAFTLQALAKALNVTIEAFFDFSELDNDC